MTDTTRTMTNATNKAPLTMYDGRVGTRGLQFTSRGPQVGVLRCGGLWRRCPVVFQADPDGISHVRHTA
jgi:hypothetical protein